MTNILCFGELLIDFLNVDTIDEAGFRLPQFRQYPGGAPANVAAAIGRLNGPARFMGQVGDDRFGRFLKQSMASMNVDMRFLRTHPTAHTPLAFVTLDDSGERSFQFLRSGTADVVMSRSDFAAGVFDDIGVFHYCSNTLTDEHIARTTWFALHRARQAGAVISFDVNLRHNLWPDGNAQFDVIRQFIELSDWIKVSREERDWIEAHGYPISDWLAPARTVWVTDGGGSIHIERMDRSLVIEPPTVTVKDTTAGGDAFTGGLLLALNQAGMNLEDDQALLAATRFAAHCGGVAVSRVGALPSLPTWTDVAEYWPFAA